MDALKPGIRFSFGRPDRLVREITLAKLFRRIAERARFETIETGESRSHRTISWFRGILTHFDQYIREIGTTNEPIDASASEEMIEPCPPIRLGKRQRLIAR